MSIFTEHFFTDTVNVYRKERLSNNDYAWLPTPVITALACALQSTENVDRAIAAIGTIKVDNLLTLDVMYCAPGVDVTGEDIIKITTSGHPEQNSYYAIMGDPNERPSKFNSALGYAKFFINKLETPPFHVAES